VRVRRITFAEFLEGLWHNFDLFDHAVEFDSMEEHEARQKALAEVKFKELDVDRCRHAIVFADAYSACALAASLIGFHLS